jgi:CRP-like cAMP-binding protein
MGGGTSIPHDRSSFEYIPPNLIHLSTLVSITVHSRRTRRARLALAEVGHEKDIILRQESSAPTEDQLQRLLSNTMKRLFLLDELSESQLEQLIASLQHRNYGRDQIIFYESGLCSAAYVIERGEVEVIINKTTVRKLGQGEIFGELALLFGIPRTATIKTSSFCSVYILQPDLYRSIQQLSRTPPISQRYRWLCQCPDLKLLSPLQMSRLFMNIKRIRFKPKEFIYREHEFVDRVILLESGTVEIVLTPALKRHLPKRYSPEDVDRALGILRPKAEESNTTLDDIMNTLNRSNSDEEGERDKETMAKLAGETPSAETLVLSEGCIVGIPLLKVFSDQRNIGLWELSATPIIEREDSLETDEQTATKGGQVEEVTHHVLSPMTLIAMSDVVCSVFTVNAYRRLFQSSSSDRRPSEATLLANSKLVTFDPSLMEYLTILGEGGFGKVLLGRYSSDSPLSPSSTSILSTSRSLYTSHHLYAVKFLSKASIQSSGNFSRVLNERKLLAAFHSPFIISLYGTFQTPTALAFVMEVLDRGDLWSILYENDQYPNGLPPDLVRFYTANVVYGLAHMHRLDVVYRDLKPENLMVNSCGYVKLIDCGLAKRIPYEELDCYGMRSVKNRSYSICGTPEYLAPEFIFCSGSDRAVDLWALGVMIYEMYLLYTPFTSPSDPHVDVESVFATIAKIQVLLFLFVLFPALSPLCPA